MVLVHEISIGPWRLLGLVRHHIKSLNLICAKHTADITQEKKEEYSRRLLRQKREKERRRQIRLGLSRQSLEGQTDPDRADILWEASSVSGLKVHRRDLDSNGWIFCCLGFGEAGRHSSSAVLS